MHLPSRPGFQFVTHSRAAFPRHLLMRIHCCRLMYACTGKDKVQFSVKVFEGYLNKQLKKTIRPPGKKHLGVNLRRADPIPTTLSIIQEQLSTERGLPEEIPAKDATKSADLERDPDGKVKPIKISSTRHKYRVKLQEPAHISSFLKMEERFPGCGMGAAVLIRPPAKMRKVGVLSRRVVMAAGPLTIYADDPIGAALDERLPTVRYTMNVIMMDENAEVTFGVKEYPPWVRRDPPVTHLLIAPHASLVCFSPRCSCAPRDD